VRRPDDLSNLPFTGPTLGLLLSRNDALLTEGSPVGRDLVTRRHCRCGEYRTGRGLKAIWWLWLGADPQIEGTPDH
jgi:hypothetical protein